MKWSEINSHPDQRVLRQFAGACLVVLIAVGLREYRVSRHELGLGLAIAGLLLGTAGLMRPSSLRWLFVGWMKLAFPLNWIVSEVVLAMIFYLLLTPLAVVFRLMGRDALDLKAKRSDRASFWVRRTANPDVRRYFRQY